MAKLIVLLAAFALFLVVANASIYRTVVEFDEDEDVNQRGQQGRCQREFQQQQQLRACQQWIRKRAQRGGGYAEDDFELELEDDDVNQRQQALQQCCRELHQVDRMCVCPVIRHAAQQVRYQGQHQPQQVRQMFQAAKNLPNICNIPVGQCQFQATPY